MHEDRKQKEGRWREQWVCGNEEEHSRKHKGEELSVGFPTVGSFSFSCPPRPSCVPHIEIYRHVRSVCFKHVQPWAGTHSCSFLCVCVQILHLAGGIERLKLECLSNPVVVEIQDVVRNHVEKTWLPLFLSTTEFIERQKRRPEVDILSHFPLQKTPVNHQLFDSCRLYWRSITWEKQWLVTVEFIHTVSARAKVKYCDYINHKLRTYFSILTGISQVGCCDLWRHLKDIFSPISFPFCLSQAAVVTEHVLNDVVKGYIHSWYVL